MTIERTVGGVGADFATFYAAWAWIVGLGNLTNDYDFFQTGNTVEPGNTWDIGGLRVMGYTVRFICLWADSHKGDPTKGFTVTLPNVGTPTIRPEFYAWTEGIINVSGLYIINNYAGVAFHSASGLFEYDHLTVCENILIDGRGVFGSYGL